MSRLDIRWRDPVTCWTRESAMEVLPVEAEAIPPALFQQAHVALQLTRVNPENLTPIAEEGTTETDVLALVRQRVSGKVRRTDIIPVLGRAGAGKSHLVRWLRHEFAREPLPQLRTVFIPKHRTSLRGVVELLLQAFADVDELAGLRDDLWSATETDKSPEWLRTAIRDRLCAGVEYEPDRTAVTEAEKEARDLLSRALPALLRDPHFAPQHLSSGSAIARLVDEKLEGRNADDAVEVAFQFTADDVQTNADDIRAAAAQAQAAVTYLMQNPPTSSDSGRTLTELAAQMLNDQLPSAIKDVFGVGGEDLKDLLVRARSILHGREDILLLVEDFAMFQGLQQGLLDAITLHDTENERLCALVTVFAVTTGYYRDHLPLTLKTRASTAYIVGRQPDDAPVRFAASYLRAIRLGMTELEARHAANTRGSSSCEGCPVVVDCHEAFGELGGEGLFPFNATLLDRALDATSDGEDFNARVFLTRVLSPVLVDDHADIERQKYPTPEAAERFDARRHRPSGSQLLTVEEAVEGERRARLALLYKDPVDSGDLRSGIHAAFGLAPLGMAGGTTRSKPRTTPKKAKRFQSDEPPLLEEIHKWATSGGMSQQARNEVRKVVAAAVLDRLPFNDSAYRRSAWTDKKVPPFFHDPQSIVLDSDTGVLSDDAIRVFIRSDQPHDVDALQSLAWLDKRGSWESIPEGFERAARLEVAINRWCQEAASELRLGEIDADELSLTAEAIEIAHALAGVVGHSLATRGELLVSPVDTAGYSKKYQEAVELLTASMQRRVGYARGTGSIVAIDWPIVRQALVSTQGGRRVLEHSDESGGHSSLFGEALGVVAKQLAEVETGAAALRRLLPDVSVLGSDTPVQLAQDLVEMATGSVTHRQLEQLRETADEILDEDVDAITATATRAAGWTDLSPIERAALTHGQWRSSADRVQRFLDIAEAVLKAATPDGATLGHTDRTAVESRWENALSKAEGALRQAIKDWA